MNGSNIWKTEEIEYKIQFLLFRQILGSFRYLWFALLFRFFWGVWVQSSNYLLIPLYPMYSTGPCPDPHLGSWNCLAHQAHIALSEPMSYIDQQGRSLGSFPTFPSSYPHFNQPSGYWPCVEPCVVGDIGK